MNLFDVIWKIGAECRDFRFLIQARGDHDVARHNGGAIVAGDEIASPPAIRLYLVDPSAVADGQTEPRRVLLEVDDDLVAGHEAVRVPPPIFGARQVCLPVGCVEGEGIPAVVTPGVSRPVRLLDNKMMAVLLCQVVAERKAGLSCADNDGVHVSCHDPYSQDCRSLGAGQEGTWGSATN